MPLRNPSLRRTPSFPGWSYRGDRRALFRASVGWTAWISPPPMTLEVSHAVPLQPASSYISSRLYLCGRCVPNLGRLLHVFVFGGLASSTWSTQLWAERPLVSARGIAEPTCYAASPRLTVITSPRDHSSYKMAALGTTRDEALVTSTPTRRGWSRWLELQVQ